MKLWIGTQPEPDDRIIIDISDDDAARMAGLPKPFEITVYDNLSETNVTIADADCGLGCRCALRFVGDSE